MKKKLSPTPEGESESDGPNGTGDASTNTPLMSKLVDLNTLSFDLDEGDKILDYHPNQRDGIRCFYCLKGPANLRAMNFLLD